MTPDAVDAKDVMRASGVKIKLSASNALEAFDAATAVAMSERSPGKAWVPPGLRHWCQHTHKTAGN
jgi:hypothetical protein